MIPYYNELAHQRLRELRQQAERHRFVQGRKAAAKAERIASAARTERTASTPQPARAAAHRQFQATVQPPARTKSLLFYKLIKQLRSYFL